jgi:hypothetical protein
MDILGDLTSKLQMIEEQFQLVSNKSSVFSEIAQLDEKMDEVNELRKNVRKNSKQIRNYPLNPLPDSRAIGAEQRRFERGIRGAAGDHIKHNKTDAIRSRRN